MTLVEKTGFTRKTSERSIRDGANREKFGTRSTKNGSETQNVGYRLQKGEENM